MISVSQTSICKHILSTILQERLNYFSILFIEKDIIKQLLYREAPKSIKKNVEEKYYNGSVRQLMKIL